MKILSIGNSFSQDAHRWLHSIAASSGMNIDTYNLFIGGCSLEQHFNCIEKNLCDYDKEGNDGEFICKTTVLDALKSDKFDVITLQQVSGHSGRPQTYLPYLTDIAEFVKKYQPQAKIYFHETWSYEIGSTHGDFKYYNNDQSEMHRRINDAATFAGKLIDAQVIRVGDVIQYLRDNASEFDIKNGGLSLNRDGFHLTLDYGRFAAALTWYKFLTGKNADLEVFVKLNPQFKLELLRVIENVVNEIYIRHS